MKCGMRRHSIIQRVRSRNTFVSDLVILQLVSGFSVGTYSEDLRIGFQNCTNRFSELLKCSIDTLRLLATREGCLDCYRQPSFHRLHLPSFLIK